MASCKPPIWRLAYPDFNPKFPNQLRNLGLVGQALLSVLEVAPRLCWGDDKWTHQISPMHPDGHARVPILTVVWKAGSPFRLVPAGRRRQRHPGHASSARMRERLFR